jgi:hypothetical protein
MNLTKASTYDWRNLGAQVNPPRIGKGKIYKFAQVSPEIREIAWKAQSRLTGRYRALDSRGKKSTVVCTAVARELAGFMWSVAWQCSLRSPTIIRSWFQDVTMQCLWTHPDQFRT